MNQTRSFLILALVFVAYLLFNAWMNEYHQPPAAPAPTASVAAAASTEASGGATVPEAATSAGANPAGTSRAPAASAAIPSGAPGPATGTRGGTISVVTDVLRLSIDTRGGTVVDARLLKYPKSLGSPQSVQLLSDTPSHFYEAQNGLVGIGGDAAPTHKSLFQATRTHYELAPGQDKLTVDLSWTGPDGVQVVKRYTLHRGSYTVTLTQQIVNRGDKPWRGQAYRQLERVVPPEPQYSNFLEKYSDQSRYSFFGAAWYGPEEKFNKLKFDDFKDHPLGSGDRVGRSVTGGWIAMEQSYFLGAWLPSPKEKDVFSTATVDKGKSPHYLIRSIGPAMTVAPGQAVTSQARLYLGPKLPSELKKVAPHFDLALNYGMMTIVARPLHWVLTKLQAATGNWGWAIVLLVLLINAACYKLYALQYRSSAHMRRLKPRMDALKERFGDDKQKLQQATMELYKKEKVNPVAGCLPVLITIPIFFGLYELLRESVELRQAPFILWIHDLSAADPYFILPILYGLVMLVQSWLMPISSGMDSSQQKMMRYMPVVSAAFFAFFPAGLALYYFVSGVSRLAIQWWVYRQVDRAEARKKEAKA